MDKIGMSRINTFKSRISVGVISEGSMRGVGLEEKPTTAALAEGEGLTIPAHWGGNPT